MPSTLGPLTCLHGRCRVGRMTASRATDTFRAVRDLLQTHRADHERAVSEFRWPQLESWLRAQGVDRGDRLLLVLGNVAPLWEVMLACIKLGVVLIPATTLLGPRDLADRVQRGDVKHVVTASEDTGKFADVPGDWTRIAVGEPVPGWLRYDDSYEHLDSFEPEVETRSDETLLLYFTSGTTARPKLVEHTHTSYPVGHLTT